MPLAILPHALREPEHPLRAILVGWLVAFVPSILLGALVSQMVPQTAQPQLPIGSAYMVGLVVVAAPVVETLIMGAVLAVLLRFLPPTAAIVVSAIGWGIAHSLAAPAWGLVIWWPFLIFSTLFVTWRKRSTLLALGIPAMVHGLHNLLPALLIYFATRS